jgi:hypothetical protein
MFAAARPCQRVATKPSVFLAPTGDDDGPCTRSRPCKTLGRGYRVAAPGAIVQLSGGRYDAQEIGPDERKRSRTPVTFRPEQGRHARIGHLIVLPGAGHLAFEWLGFPDGWEVGPSDDGPPTVDVTFRNTTGPRFWIMNAQGIRVLGGNYGPSVDGGPQIKVYNGWSSAEPRDVVVDGVYFHDHTASRPEIHTECLQVYAGIRITIRNSKFENCDSTGALQLTRSYDADVDQIRVEHNWFGTGGNAYYSVQTSVCAGTTYRGNVMGKGLSFSPCEFARKSVRMLENVLPYNMTLCAPGVTYSGNVVGGGRCSRADRRTGTAQIRATVRSTEASYPKRPPDPNAGRVCRKA